MEKYFAIIIKKIIEENWVAFSQKAEEHGEDPEEILEDLKKDSGQH